MLRREEQIMSAVGEALSELGVDAGDLEFKVEIPARTEHGDFSTNAALVAAKSVGRSPREIAELLRQSKALSDIPHLKSMELAGPGFLNFYLDVSHLHELIRQVIDEGEKEYARQYIGGQERIQLEFVSANPTGPLHIGNGWWASYGDALARVLERCDYQVSREYYVNDTGGQIRTLGASILARRAGEAPPEGGYLGEYVIEQAARYTGPEDIISAGRWAAEQNLEVIRRSLSRLGIEFDVWYSQASIEESGAVDEAISELQLRGAIFEQEGAWWLRSTEFGDTRDRVVKKSNGDFTYLAGDIAYHRNKFVTRGFDRVIDIFGADHHGQVASLKAAVSALGVEPNRLEIRLGQMISLVSSDQRVKFSKRAGNAVSLEWLIDELGPEVTRILSLSSSIDRATTIDLEEAKATSMDNPAYYIQYAHARIASLQRTRVERGMEQTSVDRVDLVVLSHPREVRLMREILNLPEVVEIAGLERAPHRIVTWLKSMAAAFHGFYHDCPILAPDLDEDVTQARMVLVDASRIALRVGLALIGVVPAEEM